MIPVYDDLAEVSSMIRAVRNSLGGDDVELFVPDLRGGWEAKIGRLEPEWSATCFRARDLPAAKNETARRATADDLLFLLPGIFPTGDAIVTLLSRLDESPETGAVCGRWSNSSGKLEVGYNVRRFPTFTAMVLDILLLNKFFPGNRSTRRYKMHDFDHEESIQVDHANDCAFLVRRRLVGELGGFDEAYAPGWFDQVDFCKKMNRSRQPVVFEPSARFVSNDRAPLIDRLVEQHYSAYRRAERIFIRRHFGPGAEIITRVVVAVGMLGRLSFVVLFPGVIRRWLITSLRSYVGDDYVRSLRSQYLRVLTEMLRPLP